MDMIKKSGFSQFVVEELEVRREDASALLADIASAGAAGDSRARNVLSKYWKDVGEHEQGARRSRTLLKGMLPRNARDPILEHAEESDENAEVSGVASPQGQFTGFTTSFSPGKIAAAANGRSSIASAAVAEDTEVPFTVPASLVSSRGNEPMLSSGSYPPSIPPRGGASSDSLKGGYAAGATAAMPTAMENDLAELRTQYSTLLHEVLKVSAERNNLAVASVQRERDFEELRSEFNKLEVAAAEAAKDAALPGLRRRGRAAADTADANKAVEADDDSTMRGAENGFALWQLLLLAIIAFLLGRISTGL